ncbi:hypothetical protein VTU32_06610 [Thermoanaerobacter sp. CM-CNRG TB177]|uniref:hypothetical protein n=1 Tax=Thermoanaerobacter sp. CM-CNRG TB177 TaxID=2800659 RepID=UPI001BDDF242|nr:hypothetical protein [Thermoanaerobacter sp. CM-CNRG TB177]MBT1278968.1 hypothetical protein [Thermoanaerobacter sp. CM-CNRG TB177]
MKRIAVIAMAVFLLLFPVSAFADANLPSVPDSTIQSSGWSNYMPAQGSGVSGAAIMQDNSTNTSLTRQWVHEGGYTSVSQQVPVAQAVWVQSQEWVPPVTHQEWVPPVTHQVWVQPPGQYELQNFTLYHVIEQYRRDYTTWGLQYVTGSSFELGTFDLNGNWHQTFNNPRYTNFPVPSLNISISSIINNTPKTVPSTPPDPYWYYKYGSAESYYENQYSSKVAISNWRTISIIWGGFGGDANVILLRGDYNGSDYLDYGVSLGWYWVGYTVYQYYELRPNYEWIQPPGHWETVVDQPGYWKTVVDQPGYWKDTSHWETTVTYQTVQDVQYTDSPHWTEYEKIIPQYELKN